MDTETIATAQEEKEPWTSSWKTMTILFLSSLALGFLGMYWMIRYGNNMANPLAWTLHASLVSGGALIFSRSEKRQHVGLTVTAGLFVAFAICTGIAGTMSIHDPVQWSNILYSIKEGR